MRKIHLHQGTLSQRLQKYKSLKYLGLSLGTGTSAITVDFKASDRIRTFDLGDGFSPSLRFWLAKDSKTYSNYINPFGWPCDEKGQKNLHGVVFQLPFDKGYLAGWSQGLGKVSLVEKKIYMNEYRAIMRAEEIARIEAFSWIDQDVMARKQAQRAKLKMLDSQKDSGIATAIIGAA